MLVSQVAWNWILIVGTCLIHSTFFKSPNEQCPKALSPSWVWHPPSWFFELLSLSGTCLLSVAKLACRFNEGRDLVLLFIAIGSVPSWALSRWEGLNSYWGSEWTNEPSKLGNLLESVFMPANNNFPWLCTVSRIRLFSWRLGLQQVNQRASPCMHLQNPWRNKALEGTSGNTVTKCGLRGSDVPKEHSLSVLFMPWSACSVLGYQDTLCKKP